MFEGGHDDCGEPVIWAVTEATGKRMPVDRDTVPNGNLFLTAPHGKVVATVVKPEVEPERARYISHFATCVNAKQHRKAPAKRRANA